MIFKKLDEDTVRCIVNEDDLKEYGITMEDFLAHRGNVEDFLRDIVEQAIDEVDFKAESGALSMQVMNLPKNRLAITFSGKAEGGMEDILSRIIKDKGLVREMMDDIDDMEEIGDEEDKDKEILFHDYDSESRKDYDVRVIGFTKFEYLAQFCNSIPDNSMVKSSLFKDDKTNLYYLVLEKERASTANFKAICELGEEFGSIMADDKASYAHLSEQAECMIKKSAISAIASL